MEGLQFPHCPLCIKKREGDSIFPSVTSLEGNDDTGYMEEENEFSFFFLFPYFNEAHPSGIEISKLAFLGRIFGS